MGLDPLAGEHLLRLGRRRFLEIGALGGAATLLTGCAATSRARDDKPENKAEAFLLSCMDYRLVQATERYMVGRGLEKKYYHVMLAGAAIAANPLTRPVPPPPPPPSVPAWNTTFWEHLATSLALTRDRPAGPLNRVFVIDHRKCGAYDIILGRECCQDRGNETTAHTDQLRRLRTAIRERYPTMRVELLLMDLNGTVEIIT
jgi:hypothetical protein